MNNEDVEHQYVSNHRTEINPEKGDGKGNSLSERKLEKFKRLRLNNTDEFNGKWRNRDVTRRKDAMRELRTAVSRFELPPSQQSRAEKLFTEVPDNIISGIPTRAVAIAICIYTSNEWHQRWNPLTNPEQECFLRSVATEYDVSLEIVGYCYGHLVNLWGEPNE